MFSYLRNVYHLYNNSEGLGFFKMYLDSCRLILFQESVAKLLYYIFQELAW